MNAKREPHHAIADRAKERKPRTTRPSGFDARSASPFGEQPLSRVLPHREKRKAERKRRRLRDAIRIAEHRRRPQSVAAATSVKTPMKPHLSLISIDDHFAPQTERICLQYDIRGLEDKPVKVDIRSARWPGSPIYLHDLSTSEKTNGRHFLYWDGKVSLDGGTLKTNDYINPLHSPFKVKVYAEGNSPILEATFKVLYHSLELAQGPWTPDEEEPQQSDRVRYVQYRLNELGYFAGPVGNDTRGYLRKAIARYQYHHRSELPHAYRRSRGRITKALVTALADPENEKRFAVETEALADPSKTSMITVEALTLERQSEIARNKSRLERQRLNRPLIPIEAIIFLKGKGGQRVLAPQAVGPVRINWRFEDPREDLTAQHSPTVAAPSRGRAYISKCMHDTEAVEDNVESRHGGIRRAPSSNYYRPALLGKYLIPYRVRRDSAARVIYSHAHDAADRHPKRLGKAGFFFRPSIIAGDDYRIRAEIDFKGESNQAALETAHSINADPKSRIQFRTGILRVRRRHEVAMVINWPGTKPGLWANEGQKVKNEFAKAHLHLDDLNMATRTITEVISEEEYRRIVRRYTRHRRTSRIHLSDSHAVGVSLPQQGATSASRYKRLLHQFCERDFMNRIRAPLQRVISKKVRDQHPEGLVILHYRSNAPTPVLDWDDRAVSNHKGLRKALMAVMYQPSRKLDPRDKRTQSLVSTASQAAGDSVVYINQDSAHSDEYLLAHEIGHCFWLRHGQHTRDGPTSHHDRKDSNCIMSYPSDNCTNHGIHHKVANFKPHFCGKCNLRLRGWNIRYLPAGS